jgi:hypothetical protein
MKGFRFSGLLLVAGLSLGLPTTDSSAAQEAATVHVCGSSGLLLSQALPAGSGFFWNVFRLDGQTGAITPVNQRWNRPPSILPCREKAVAGNSKDSNGS